MHRVNGEVTLGRRRNDLVVAVAGALLVSGVVAACSPPNPCDEAERSTADLTVSMAPQVVGTTPMRCLDGSQESLGQPVTQDYLSLFAVDGVALPAQLNVDGHEADCQERTGQQLYLQIGEAWYRARLVVCAVNS